MYELNKQGQKLWVHKNISNRYVEQTSRDDNNLITYEVYKYDPKHIIDINHIDNFDFTDYKPVTKKAYLKSLIKPDYSTPKDILKTIKRLFNKHYGKFLQNATISYQEPKEEYENLIIHISAVFTEKDTLNLCLNNMINKYFKINNLLYEFNTMLDNKNLKFKARIIISYSKILKPKTIKLIVTNNVWEHDYYGPGDCYEWCEKNNAKHIAFKKGDIVYALLEDWKEAFEETKEGWVSSVKVLSEEDIQEFKNTCNIP